MDRAITVSVIIPIYNIEPELLRRCVESVAAQTYDPVEIILVVLRSYISPMEALQVQEMPDLRLQTGNISALWTVMTMWIRNLSN